MKLSLGGDFRSGILPGGFIIETLTLAFLNEHSNIGTMCWDMGPDAWILATLIQLSGYQLRYPDIALGVQILYHVSQN